MPIDQADFVVSNITIPSVIDWTDVFQLSFTIKNLGLASAGYSQIGYRFDGAPVYPGNSGSFAYSGGIAAQGSETFTITVDSLSLLPGEHTIWVAADVMGLHNESDEANNLGSVTFTVGPAVAKPELFIAAGTVSTSPYVVKDGVLDFSYALSNNGTGAAGGSVTYFKVDQQPTSASFATSQIAAGLDVGASQTYNHSISVAGLSTGVHTLWLAADGANSNTENNEFNNWTPVTFTVMDDKPDFIVTGITLDNSNVIKGQDLQFTYTVQNVGPKASTSGYILYDVSRTPDQFNNRGGWESTGTLAYGESQTFTGSISTSSLTLGSHGLVIKVDATGLKAETSESNNTNSIAFTVVSAPKPDQIIESITGPTTVVQGADLDFSYVLKDANSANTTNSFGSIIFAVDRQPTAGSYDFAVGAGTLPGGGSLTFNEVLHANLSVGQHTLWLKADGFGNVNEADESNNLTSFTFTVTTPAPNPDLSIVSINGATTIEKGFNLNLAYAIKNGGTLPSAASNVGYMIDQAADSTHYLSAPTVNALAADGTLSLTAVIDTSNLSVGMHTVWFAADVFGSVTEVSESNNTGSFTFTVTAAQPHPDLVVDGINAPLSVVKGASFDFSYVVKNIGTGSTTFSSQAVYLLDDLSSVPTGEALGIVGPLAAGATGPVTDSFYTTNLSIGQHTLYVLADWGNTLTELDEANNWREITFNVTAPPTVPDVAVKTLTTADLVLQQGEWLNFSYTLENLGAGFANLARAAYWIDGNPLLATRAYNIPPGYSEAGPYNGQASTSGLSVGQHILWVEADYFGEVSESNEANNRASLTFTVTTPGQADLVVGNIQANASVVQGAAFDVSYVVTNSGTASAGTSWAGLRVDQAPTQSNVAAAHFANALAAGGSQTLTSRIDTSALSVGQHTLWISADYTGLVAETDDTNNATSVTFTVTAPPQADLVVSSLAMGSASVVQGQNLGFVYTIVNEGPAQSNFGYGGFYIDGMDEAHFRGFNFTDPLGWDASRMLFNGFNTAGLSVGQHTLWVGADNLGHTSESDESNNWRSITFEVTAPQQAGGSLYMSSAASMSMISGHSVSIVGISGTGSFQLGAGPPADGASDVALSPLSEWTYIL
jgi:subtilase family serine protease